MTPTLDLFDIDSFLVVADYHEERGEKGEADYLRQTASSMKETPGLVARILSYPRVSLEMGYRIMDVPESVLEEAPPEGFSEDGWDEFVGLYGQLRRRLTNRLADTVGHDEMNRLLDTIHTKEPSC